MDRLFLLQNPDGEIDRMVIKEILHEERTRLCDGVITVPDDCTPKDVQGYLLRCIPGLHTPQPKIIPVGSIEFTERFLGHPMHPIEIPDILLPMVKREYRIVKGQDIPSTDAGKYFFKDVTNLKRWNSLLYDGDISRFIDEGTEYVIAEKVNFTSEYRVFVCRGDVQAVMHYLGDPMEFPDPDYIQQCIRLYEQIPHPLSYTMDIGIHDGQTDIIEIHAFVSCGLYGFQDDCIPDMLEDGYAWYQKQTI